ncbi:MAG: O-sialoglycoprotein endopeptidase [Clostridia bacterium]|nr:O-sialoglycoprotein endopeptidase [Clostridia bacterium]
MLFLGIDTSCYTTSVAVVDDEGRILEDRRRLLSVPEGKMGLRQSEMIFQHLSNLHEIFPTGYRDFGAVAASVAPTPEEDSYMPVFNVARTFGEIIANTNGAFFYPLTHQTGHIGAALYGKDRMDGDVLCFHVSGGTTDLLKVRIEKGIIEKIEPLCSTTDIAAGQLIDRIGVMMGASFPAGGYVSSIAENGKAADLNFRYRFDRISFSGAENQLKDMLESSPLEDVAATLLKHVAKILYKAVSDGMRMTGIEKTLFFGGVMRSGYIRKFLSERLRDIRFAEVEYSSDNAVGLALQARNIYMENDHGKTDRRKEDIL